MEPMTAGAPPAPPHPSPLETHRGCLRHPGTRWGSGSTDAGGPGLLRAGAAAESLRSAVCRLGMPAAEGRGLWRLPWALPQPLPQPLSPQCSVTCGKGYKQRLVSCSEIYTGKENYEYGHQAATNCPGTQPPSVQPCYLRECPASATWRVGNWGSVSRWLSYPITGCGMESPAVTRPA